jgi:hypothetical protein
MRSAEVLEVILTENSSNYYQIKFKFLGSPGNNDENYNTALPLNINVKSIPVPGEIVLIVTAASSFAGNYRLQEGSFYYLSIINIQSNINYNGVPTSSKVPSLNNTSYPDASLGISFSLKTEQPSRKKKTFKISNEINALQLFEGDVVVEGRYGNSIRLGSTINNTSQVSKQPTWVLGTVGDPITIITNSLKNTTGKGFRIEDINKDDASIYLTSTQRIPLKLIGPQTTTLLKISAAAKNLSGKQIILNSDRIVLNAKSNEIFLSSKNGISVTSKGDIVLESSKEITLNAPKVNLTSTAFYSAVNGELLEIILNGIAQGFQTIPVVGQGIATSLSTLISSTPFKSTKVKL